MVELKLDTAAVNALFPEGTEARIGLQQAVINNIVTNILEKRIDAEVIKQIDAAVASVGMSSSIQSLVQTELNGYLQKRGWNQREGDLTEVSKAAVKKAVEQEVKNLSYLAFDEVIKECTDRAKTDFADGMKRKIDYALQNSESHFAARLNERFKEVLDAALTQRLGLGATKV